MPSWPTMPLRARRTSSSTSRPRGLRTAPADVADRRRSTHPRRASAAAAWLPTLPKPWTATRAPARGSSTWRATARVTIATPSPVASTRPAVPPSATGLPVTIAGVWPCRRPYSSISQAISLGPLPMSGAMMSRIGPSTFSMLSMRARVARWRSPGERSLRIDVDAALGAAERQVGERGLPGHRRGQGADPVEVDLGVVAQAALVGAARAVVLHPVGREDPQAAVVHPHRHLGGDLAVGAGQQHGQLVVQARWRRRRRGRRR